MSEYMENGQGLQTYLHRQHTRTVQIGGVCIGGGAPVAIQSMTNTRTEDVAATVAQIHRLEQAGCEIIRCTVPTPEAARALKEIKREIRIPPGGGYSL